MKYADALKEVPKAWLTYPKYFSKKMDELVDEAKDIKNPAKKSATGLAGRCLLFPPGFIGAFEGGFIGLGAGIIAYKITGNPHLSEQIMENGAFFGMASRMFQVLGYYACSMFSKNYSRIENNPK